MAKTQTQQPSPRSRPSRGVVATEAAKQTKKQIAHGRRQARQQRIVLLSVLGLVLLIVAILAAGVIGEVVIKPGRPVAIVNGTNIRTDVYDTLVTYRRYNLQDAIARYQSELDKLDPADETNQFLTQFYQQQITQLQTQLNDVDQLSVDELIEDVLIQEKANEAGLVVTSGEVALRLEELKQPAPDTQTPVTGTEILPTATPVPQTEIDARYQAYLDAVGITDKEFRQILRRGMEREKVDELLAGQVITTGLVIHVQVIQTDTQEKADQAQQRFESGEEWAVIANELSTDAQVETDGGDLGWVAEGQLTSRYAAEVETLAFSLAPGTLGQTQAGGKFYVVRVVEKNENGPLPDSVVNQRKASALSDWLAERKASPDVKIERILKPTPVVPVAATPAP